ncbi:Uncharacterised protein [Lelliottia amnigena]|nr:Uncharacterised protein [Lelliottia amnigena]
MWINPLIEMVLGVGLVCGIGWIILKFWPYFFSILFVFATLYIVWDVLR